MIEVSESFPRYADYSPGVPAWFVSEPGKPTIHRFYDSSPISPSGTYIALTEFEFEDRLPVPGDHAAVVVRSLRSGDEVYRSKTIAWDTQVGAQAQWGSDDTELYFNRMERDEWVPYGVRVNFHTGQELRLHGTVYAVNSRHHVAASPDLVQIGTVQAGYGVIVPSESRERYRGAPADRGLTVTDTVNGESRVLVTFATIREVLKGELSDAELEHGALVGFHAKYSPDGERIMFIVRWRPDDAAGGHPRNWIVTMRSDGSDLALALSAARWGRGHHPNWCPDSEHIVMNLEFAHPSKLRRLAQRAIRSVRRRLGLSNRSISSGIHFARFRYDGTAVERVAPSHMGSGHPTWHRELDAILTDSYPDEPIAFGDGTVPIRLVSPAADVATTLIRVRTRPEFAGPRQEWRVDPHPAWNGDADTFAFNGIRDGVRGVFVADMSAFIDESKRGDNQHCATGIESSRGRRASE